MKRILLIVVCALQGMMMYAWKPQFVGHRGCIIGVENTREAFINAKDHYHYQGVETDLMTTKDNKLVMCHDADLSRFGHSGVTISDYTLAQLQAMTLTQKRYGTTYTAHLLSVDEFCALIDSLGLFPIIEIKGSGGIYEESMYNFPQVVTALQNHNLMDKAIILASYKASLEYIRTNYPQLKCQLLRYTLKEEDFEWCVEKGVEPSMCNSGGGNLTQELVKRCHDANMNVGVWVVDWSNVYESNCGWGCYMCTTDSLTPALQKDLPEVQWDKLKPFDKALEPLYINAIVNPVAPAAGEQKDTLLFYLDKHQFMVHANGATGKGGWVLKDYSTTGEPTSYKQAAFLTQAVSPLRFIMERVDTSTVNVYEMNNSTLVGAWNISTAAPLYPATSMTLSDSVVYMLVGDTLWIEATVEPEECTSSMTWRVDQSRAITLSRDGYKARVIAKQLCDATLTASIDDIKRTCAIHVVKEKPQALDDVTLHPQVSRFIYNGRIYIRTAKGIFDLLGNAVEL